MNTVRKLISLLVFVILGSPLGAQNVKSDVPPFLNQNLEISSRVEDLIGRLTLTEKATLLNHRGKTVTVDGFDILSDGWNQCLHGVLWTEPTTNFPTSIALGATWDTELLHKIAVAISDEARAIYNGWKKDPAFRGEHKGLIYRSPVINISRNPYWGRINEIYGEDPYHTGRMGVAFVTGIQGDDPNYLKLASTLKHYAVNNVERGRQQLSATVSERMLYEYWLPHFRACVVEGKAQSLMASYNAINGTPNNINKMLLTDILKNQWGHEGFVVSDLGGVRTMVQGHEKNQMSYEEAVGRSIMAGCDFSDSEYEQYIPRAILQGYLTEDRLNDALRRVLTVRFRLGEFDKFESVPYSSITEDVICSPEHRALSLLAAQKSIVLLKNDKGFLPLDRNALKKVAVIGPYADLFNEGNYGGIPVSPVTPFQGIRNALSDEVEVTYLQGAEITPARVRRGQPIPPHFDRAQELSKAVKLASESDVVILFLGTTADIEVEGRDRTTLNLPGNQNELLNAVCKVNKKVVVVLMSAGPLAVPDAKKKAPAIIQGWWPGEEGGTAIASVIFGDYNPAGRLPYTMYASDAQVPSVDEYDISKGFTYMYLKGKPQYAFGHGLSYTTFSYGNMQISKDSADPGETVKVSFSIQNTGKMDGEEVVQMYVRDVKSKVVRPSNELRGFERVSLKAGEQKTVTMDLPVSSLAFYDEDIHAFNAEAGEYRIMVGSASDDIRLEKQFYVK